MACQQPRNHPILRNRYPQQHMLLIVSNNYFVTVLTVKLYQIKKTTSIQRNLYKFLTGKNYLLQISHLFQIISPCIVRFMDVVRLNKIAKTCALTQLAINSL